jgi:hypothetical protein
VRSVQARSSNRQSSRVIGRRDFLFAAFAPCLLRAQTSPRPRLAIIWSATIPDEFARDSLVFPRAYAACPEHGFARRALETGSFPHAFNAADVSLRDRFPAPDSATDPNLIVIVTAESGDGDDSPMERSVHVPLAIRWPGRLEPRSAPEILISHVDIFATLLPGTGSQGRDLSTLLERGQGDVPDAVYGEGKLGQKDEWRMLIRGFDKIIFNPQLEVTHQFNLADDPSEASNLVHERDHELTRDAMLALARVWMRRLGDGLDPSGLRRR